MINDKDLNSILYMSRLDVSESEKEKFRKQIGDILSYFDILTSINTVGVDNSVNESIEIEDLRTDEVRESFSPSILKTFAADFLDGYFSVPRILNDPSCGEEE
ncbi:MAG: Asp-tRNA(Asn)/Glu-tRNA(Gln) amidotransferase subunit GatC [Spirochaetales bacterium]|nr:Asp-tRNA(Asn)/Glu-tRNA(Gln) amidotransferase subunit GatC [Spirochaetales bacterium]